MVRPRSEAERRCLVADILMRQHAGAPVAAYGAGRSGPVGAGKA